MCVCACVRCAPCACLISLALWASSQLRLTCRGEKRGCGMWNLLNPLDPTYSYGNRVHVQRRVHACGSDSNRAQSSACMRDLACNLSASSPRVSSLAIGRRVAVARGVQRVSWYGGPVAGAARCSVGSEPFLHRILYSGLAASQPRSSQAFRRATDGAKSLWSQPIPHSTPHRDTLAMTVQDVCTPRVMGTANSTQPPAATEQSSRRDAVVFNPSYKICAMGGRKGGAPRCGITQLRYKSRHTVGRTDPHIIIGLLSQHLASMIAWAQLSRTIDGQWEARAARSGVNSSSALPRLGRAWSATSHLRARAA